MLTKILRTTVLLSIFMNGKQSSINTEAKVHIRKDTLHLFR